MKHHRHSGRRSSSSRHQKIVHVPTHPVFVEYGVHVFSVEQVVDGHPPGDPFGVVITIVGTNSNGIDAVVNEVEGIPVCNP